MRPPLLAAALAAVLALALAAQSQAPPAAESVHLEYTEETLPNGPLQPAGVHRAVVRRGLQARAAGAHRVRAPVRAPDALHRVAQRPGGAALRHPGGGGRAGRRGHQRHHLQRPHQLLPAGALAHGGAGALAGGRPHGDAGRGAGRGQARKPARGGAERAPAGDRQPALRALDGAAAGAGLPGGAPLPPPGGGLAGGPGQRPAGGGARLLPHLLRPQQRRAGGRRRHRGGGDPRPGAPLLRSSPAARTRRRCATPRSRRASARRCAR